MSVHILFAVIPASWFHVVVVIVFAPETSGVKTVVPCIKALMILESSPSLLFPVAQSSDFPRISSVSFNLSSHFSFSF